MLNKLKIQGKYNFCNIIAYLSGSIRSWDSILWCIYVTLLQSISFGFYLKLLNRFAITLGSVANKVWLWLGFLSISNRKAFMLFIYRFQIASNFNKVILTALLDL